MKLFFNPKQLHVVVEESGEIDFLTLYRSIREWEASAEGIAFDAVLEGSGNIQLPDGSRTPRTMIFLGGWKLKSDKQISIVNGYVTGRSQDGYYNPIAEESCDNIRILSSEEDEVNFVPTESQKRYALEQGKLFSEDWEVQTEPRPSVRRKDSASERIHTVFGLYWFLKQEWLRNVELMKFRFPIQGDNRVPKKDLIRAWQWSADWEISHRDRRYLEDGPLYIGTKEIVPPLATEGTSPTSAPVVGKGPEIQRGWSKHLSEMFALIAGWLERIWKKRPRLTTQSEARKKAVTIGIVTVLPEEYAAIKCQLDNPFEYTANEGRKNNGYLLGTMPAFGNELHTVAATMAAMGNNSAAIRATALINDFPNLREVIMVGIAGAVPNPNNVETHVRLGDVVVSGEKGVIQYDFTKDSGNAKIENRHNPRPPSQEMLRAYRRLEAEYICGKRPWMDEMNRTTLSTMQKARPAAEFDKLGDSNNPLEFLDHPSDKTRYPDEPKIFIGTIGAANKLLKDAKQRDELRDKFGVRAIEMESSGVSDASDEFDIAYFTIRGTCDYCDTNKNDDWHVYAATIAGAYCRALLGKTPAFRIIV